MDVAGAEWTTWLEQQGPALLLLARRWAQTHADAEDIVQDAFIRFWRARANASDPKAYLCACLRSAALDWLRAGSRRRRRDEKAAHEICAEPMFERSAEDAEFAAGVERHLDRLPEEQRLVLTMKIWGELTFAQIAEALDIPPNTAASRYRYALETLRKEMQEVPK